MVTQITLKTNSLTVRFKYTTSLVLVSDVSEGSSVGVIVGAVLGALVAIVAGVVAGVFIYGFLR